MVTEIASDDRQFHHHHHHHHIISKANTVLYQNPSVAGWLAGFSAK